MKRVLAAIGFALIAVTVADIAVRVQATQQPNPATGSGDASSGKAVFNERCAVCHYDQSAAQKIGPGLKGIYARGTFADGRKVDDAGMIRWIENGGKDMPPMKDVLKPDEIRALVSYLKTL